jgi:hypothetical protein
MNITRWWSNAAVALACVGMTLPAQAMAAVPATPGQVRDVALGNGGRLEGQVVDSQGQPQAASEVTVWQNDQQVAATQADADGNFAFTGLRSGVHQVAAGQGASVLRLWAPQTAPPAAGDRALVVSDQSVVRGAGAAGFVNFVTNPWVLAGVVAAAIAIPIALNNNDDSGS